jgi:hypothetical protein
MPRKNLTHRQSEFAAAVAQGKTLADAYRVAYEPKNPMAASVYPNSRRAVKHPAIAARIQELQVELLPAPGDMKAIYQHGLATIIQLSISCEDSRVRFRAAEWLCQEAEKQLKQEADEQPRGECDEIRRDEIISELREIYRKALPDQAPLVEVVGEVTAADEVEGTTSTEV